MNYRIDFKDEVLITDSLKEFNFYAEHYGDDFEKITYWQYQCRVNYLYRKKQLQEKLTEVTHASAVRQPPVTSRPPSAGLLK